MIEIGHDMRYATGSVQTTWVSGDKTARKRGEQKDCKMNRIFGTALGITLATGTLCFTGCTKEEVKTNEDKTEKAVEKAADKTKEVAKDMVEKTKEVVKDKIAPAIEKGVDKTKEMVKDIGGKTKSGAEKAADKTKDVAEDAADKTKEAVKPVETPVDPAK